MLQSLEGKISEKEKLKTKSQKNDSKEKISNDDKKGTEIIEKTNPEKFADKNNSETPKSKLKFLKIRGNYKTTFWRYQHHSPECLATVEAVYYFYKELATALDQPKISENVELILFFYILQFKKLFRNYESKEVFNKKNQDYFKGIKKIK